MRTKSWIFLNCLWLIPVPMSVAGDAAKLTLTPGVVGAPAVWETPRIIGAGRSRALCHAFFNEGGKDKMIVGIRVESGGPRLDIWSYEPSMKIWTCEQSITGSGWHDSHDIAVADLDKDGNMDITVTMRFVGLWVLMNKGSGNWQQTHLDSRYGNTVQIGDVDHDGNLDIVHSPGGWVSGYYVRVFYGDGNGNFSNGGGPACPQATAGCMFSLVDINHDGLLDLMGASAEYHGSDGICCFRAYLNQGNRTWSASLVLSDSLRINNAFCGSAGDMNNDGYADYVAVDNTPPLSNQLAVLYGGMMSSDYTWQQQNYGTNYSSPLNGAYITDINHDGWLDVLVAGGAAFNGIKIFYGDGQGNYPESQVIADAYAIALMDTHGDYNGDGLTDIAFSTDSADGFGVIFGGIATPTPTVTPTVIPTLTSTPTPTVTQTSIPTLTPIHFLSLRDGGYATPNPFLPKLGQKAFFNFGFESVATVYTIRIYNLRGQLQRTLINTREWDGRGESGHVCEGGVYVYQIEAEGKRVNGKVVLLK